MGVVQTCLKMNHVNEGIDCKVSLCLQHSRAAPEAGWGSCHRERGSWGIPATGHSPVLGSGDVPLSQDCDCYCCCCPEGDERGTAWGVLDGKYLFSSSHTVRMKRAGKSSELEMHRPTENNPSTGLAPEHLDQPHSHGRPRPPAWDLTASPGHPHH